MSNAIYAFALLVIGLSLFPGPTPVHAHQDDEAPTNDESVVPAKDDTPSTSRFLDERTLFEQLLNRTQESDTRREKPITLASSTITVISSEDLQRSGIRFLSDVFRMVPGLEVLRISSTESNVNLRGYNDTGLTAQGMLALIDGRLAYNEFFGNVFWDALPVSLDGIKQIELIRGPGSFVYGPNAMQGFVNIVTKSPLDYERDLVNVSTGVGSYDSTMSTLTFVKREADAGFKATLSWDDIGEFEGEDISSKKKFMELRYEKLVDGDPDHRIEFTGGVTEQNFEILAPTLFGLPPATLANDVEEEFVKLNYTLGDLKAQVFWTGFKASSVPDRSYAPFDTDLDTIDFDLLYTMTPEGWDGHTLTVGTGYRRATFKTTNLDVTLGRHDTDQFWGFIQDEFKLADDVYVTAGVRVDNHSTSGTNVSPRLAAVWEFKPDQYLRASVGFGFRNPSLREIWFNLPVTVAGLPAPVIISGNEDLDAEKIRSFELGYYGSPLEKLNVGVNLYYNLIDDLIVFQPVEFFPAPIPPGTPSKLAPFNENNEESYGVELEFDYLFSDSISGFFNYAYGNRENRDTNERIDSAPRHKINVGVRMSTPVQTSTSEQLSAMLWVNYFDNVEFIGMDVDAYTLLNGQISYDFFMDSNKARLYVGAFNMLDNDHQEHPEGQSYGLILKVGFDLSW